MDKAVEQEVLTWASNINEFDSGESVKDKIEQAIDIIVEQDDLAKELAYNEDFVEWWMNKMNHLPPEEREERIGITDDIDYIVAQNWIRNILDNDALKDEWGAFKAQ